MAHETIAGTSRQTNLATESAGSEDEDGNQDSTISASLSYGTEVRAPRH
jgi:hypothetical protein